MRVSREIKNENRSYFIRKDDERPPVRYKKNPRSKEHRYGREFPKEVKENRFEKVGEKCELCSKKLKFSNAEFHHIMSLTYAFHYFPELTKEILSSEENCQILCEKCHIKLHKKDSLSIYEKIAVNLLRTLKDWEENPPEPYVNKKQRRKLAQLAEIQRRKKKTAKRRTNSNKQLNQRRLP